jgi:hypothetical protein
MRMPINDGMPVRTETASVRYCGTRPELLQTIGNVKVETFADGDTTLTYTPHYRVERTTTRKVWRSHFRLLGFEADVTVSRAYERFKEIVTEIEIENPEQWPVKEDELTDWEECD